MAPATRGDPSPPATGPAPSGTAAVGDSPATTDGRLLRRQRNRDAVVEALLDLYRDGNLKPNAEEIAERSGLSPRSLFRYFDDVNDLTRAAIARQEALAIPLVPIEATPEAPLADRLAALVDQRVLLFESFGHVAAVVRLRSPFQPLLAAELTRNRAFLRSQIKTLFAPELKAMGEAGAATALAAADVLTAFESHQLLRRDQRLTSEQTKTVMVDTLSAILIPAP
jgi:AcrR family transcriptional regulator